MVTGVCVGEALVNGSSWPTSYQLTESCNSRDLGEMISYVVNVFRNASMATGMFRGHSTAFGRAWFVWKIELWTVEYERRAGNPISGRDLSEGSSDRQKVA